MIDEELTYFDVEDTASLLGVHPETVRRWCRAGKLPHFRAGERGRLRIPVSALLTAQRHMVLKLGGELGGDGH